MTMLDYIREQPAVFQRMLDDRQTIAAPFCRIFGRKTPDHLYLIASGTSYHAANTAAPFVEAVLDCQVSVKAPSQIEKPHGGKTMAVLISQGGKSTNMLSLAERLRETPTIALTGDLSAPLNALCNDQILIPCGEELVGPKTKGYTSTILTLYLMALGAAQGMGRLHQGQESGIFTALQVAANQYADNVASAERWVQQNAQDLRALKKTYLSGKKQGHAIASEGALKLMETMMISAAAFDFEEYLHGPSCSLSANLGGFYLLPLPEDPDHERMLRLVAYHRERSPFVYTIGSRASDDPRDCVTQATGKWYTQPFEQILPMQVLSACIPGQLGIEGVGMQHFKELDRFLNIKFKATKT